MAKRGLRQMIAQCSHLSEHDLFLAADGALRGFKARRVDAHLKRCWTCRMEVDHQRRAFHAVAEYQQGCQRDSQSGAVDRERRIALRLDEIFEPRAATHGSAMARRTNYSSALAWSAAAVAVVSLGILFFRAPAVSADTVIDRASAAETKAAVGLLSPVVKQQLKLRRRTRGQETESNLVVWTDLSIGQRRTSSPTVEWDGYQRILTQNHLASGHNLLAGTHREWRKNVVCHKESVSEGTLAGGAEAILVSTEAEGPFATDAITRMELLVRSSDWHAIRQTVHFQQAGEVQNYEVEEVATTLVARNALPPGLFPSSEPDGPPGGSANTVAPAPPPAPPLSTRLPEEASNTAEIRALLLVHQIGACAGGQIEYIRGGDGWITVRGEVSSEDRKKEVTRALHSVAHLRLDIKTAEEFLVGIGASAAAASLPAGSGRGAGQTTSLLDLLLNARSIRLAPEQVTGIVNASIALSGSALEEIWELRRIVERYPEQSVASLSVEDRSAIRRMFQDHLTRLEDDMSHLKSAMAPIIPGCQDCVPAATTGDKLAAVVMTEFRNVQEIDRSVTSLLKPATSGNANPAAVLQALSRALFASERSLEALRESVQRAL